MRKKLRQWWIEAGERNGWYMPPRPSMPWRMPVIRHVWAIWLAWRIERHYRYGLGSIGIPTGYDQWALIGIFHGFWFERATITDWVRQ